MTNSSVAFPEYCRYCPHRTSVTAACDPGARQTLIQGFAASGEDAEQTCPIYDDIRAEGMVQLSSRLNSHLDERRDR